MQTTEQSRFRFRASRPRSFREFHYWVLTQLDRYFLPDNLARLKKHQTGTNIAKVKDDVGGLISSMQDYTHFGPYKYTGVVQDTVELQGFLRKAKELNPKIAMEIGTSNGGTLYCLSHYTQELLISIDLPAGNYGGGYTTWRQQFYQEFAHNSPNLNLKLIRANSHDPATLKQVQEVLGNRKLDLLLIDGDHTYLGAKLDYEMYGPLVRPGGMIILHDIFAHQKFTDCDVYKLWDEIKATGKQVAEINNNAALGFGYFLV